MSGKGGMSGDGGMTSKGGMSGKGGMTGKGSMTGKGGNSDHDSKHVVKSKKGGKEKPSSEKVIIKNEKEGAKHKGDQADGSNDDDYVSRKVRRTKRLWR